LRLLEKLPGFERHLHAVERGDLALSLVERGSIEAAATDDITCTLKAKAKGSPVATTIKWIIDEGTLVKKGDRLIELDDSGLQERLRAQKVAHEQAVALKTQAAEQLALVRKDNELELRLAEVGLKLTELELEKEGKADRAQRQILELKGEQARLLLERARLRVKPRETQAEAEVRSRTAVVEQEAAGIRAIEDELRDCMVVAPRDGLVLYAQDQGTGRALAQQAVLARGESVREGQRMLRVCSLSQMVVNTRVHEALVSRLRPGQRAQVRVDAYPGKVREGEVKQVANVALQPDWLSADVKVYPTLIALSGQSEGLRPGMSAEVRILLEQRAGVLHVPLHAVLGKGRQRYCFVKTQEGIVERPVVVGLSNDTAAEIRDGLAEGDMVLASALLIRALSELRPGAGPGARGQRPGSVSDILVRTVRLPPDEEPQARTLTLSYGLTFRDVDAFASIPGVADLVLIRSFPQEVHRLERRHNGMVVATTEAFADRVGLALESGRFLSAEDNSQLKNVAVLGAATAANLFPADDPLGQTVRAGSHCYQVVGVLHSATVPAAALPADILENGLFVPLATCRVRFGDRVRIRTRGSFRLEAVQLSAVLVGVDAPEQRPVVAELIRGLLETSHHQKDWEVTTPGKS
jgi:RND family efflux transporter MFP subunit